MPLGNGDVLSFGKYVIFPVALKGENFLIARPEAHGEDKVYSDFATLEGKINRNKGTHFFPPAKCMVALMVGYAYLLIATL